MSFEFIVSAKFRSYVSLHTMMIGKR